jgi:hypothetical protein
MPQLVRETESALLVREGGIDHDAPALAVHSCALVVVEKRRARTTRDYREFLSEDRRVD